MSFHFLSKTLISSLLLYVVVGLISTFVADLKETTPPHSLAAPIQQPSENNALAQILASKEVEKKADKITQPSPSTPPIVEGKKHPPEVRESAVLGTFTIEGPPIAEKPVDPSGTIMIPKINVNSPIAFDVPINTPNAYEEALNRGVAHAAGTGKPTEINANTYLFAHSTANQENIARYAAVFTRLKELDPGDKIIVFYNNKRYDYEMVEEEIVSRFDVSVLTRNHDYSALTLQTCDPPGVPENRFITTAKLIGIYTQ